MLLTALLLSTCLAFLPVHAQPSGASLRVGIKVIEPFVIAAGEHYTGYSIDVWEEIASALGVQSEYVLFNSVDEQIQAIQSGAVDVAFSAISMTAERERVVDFTQPYYISGLRILTLPPEQQPLRDLLTPLWSIALIRLLTASIVCALILAHIIYFMERRINPQFSKGYLRGLWESFWWLISIIATGEYGDKETRRPSRRIVTMVFWLLGVAFIAQFTATITTQLTVQHLTGGINGPLDLLRGQRVVTVKDSDAEKILAAQSIPFQTVPAAQDAYRQIDLHQVDAVVLPAPILQYYVSHAGQGKAVVVGPAFEHIAFAVAVPIASPLRKSINEAILNMDDAGVLSQINEIWFGAQ